MNNIVLYRPSELTRLEHAMDRMLRESLNWPVYDPFNFFGDGGHSFMPVDIQQTKDSVVVKASLPGIKLDDVDISITDNILTIKGETKGEEETKEAEFVYKESYTGKFSRSVGLPEGLDTGKAEGVMENGILTVTVPRLEETKLKSIKVQPKPAKKEK